MKKRTKQYRLRLSEEEFNMIKENAKANYQNMADYIRSRCINQTSDNSWNNVTSDPFVGEGW